MALAVGGLLLAPAASQAAAGSDELSCTFTATEPDVYDIPGIAHSEQLTAELGRPMGDAEDDLRSELGLAPNSGYLVEERGFSFSQTTPAVIGFPTRCLHIDLDGQTGEDPDGKDDTDIYPATISSGGSYSNELCGTGVVRASAAIDIDNAAPGMLLRTEGEIDAAQVVYGMQLAGGAGVSSSLGNASFSPVPGNTNPLRTASGAVYVRTTGVPATPGKRACVDSDQTAFRVHGVFNYAAEP